MKKFFLLKGYLVAIFSILSAILLYWVFANNMENSILSYIIYTFSFYSLTVLVIFLSLRVKKIKLQVMILLKKNNRTNTVQVVPELTTDAKKAVLTYQVLERKEKVTLVAVRLKTGRSHQIRVQMKHIGHPIFGDVRYGGDILSKGHNLALWAYKLEFKHPITKEQMTFTVYPPADIIPWKIFTSMDAVVSKIKFI